jgi:GTP diphosphokinase / guanosine-3',5'-bis(diphosphate) 3'-diphosphatase
MDDPLIIKALNFATKAFGDRPRYTGGGGLYIEHPKEVATVLVAAGVTDPEVIAAALLHDTVEDTGTTLSAIEEGFGARVAQFVDDLTDRYTQEAYGHLPIGQRKDLERQRLAGVRQESRLIKIADLISNFRSFAATAASDRAFLFFDWAKRVLDTFSRVKLGNSPIDQIESTLRRQAQQELFEAMRRVRTRLRLPTAPPGPEPGRDNSGPRRSV